MRVGFEQLCDSMEEPAVDVLDSTAAMWAFMVRTMLDNVLPPTFLVGRDGVALGHNRRRISREYCFIKMEKTLAPKTSVPTSYTPIIIAPITTVLTPSESMISTPATSTPTTSALKISVTTTYLILLALLPALRPRSLG